MFGRRFIQIINDDKKFEMRVFGRKIITRTYKNQGKSLLKARQTLSNILHPLNRTKRREKRAELKDAFDLKKIYELNKRLNKKYPNYYIIVPYAPWGDFVAGCSILCNIKAKTPDKKIVILCKNENQKSVARAFSSIDHVEIIDEEMYCYLCFSNKYINGPFVPGKIFVLSHWQPAKYKNILPKHIYNIYANMLGLTEPYQVEEVNFSDKDKEIALEHFEKLGLKQNTVFLSPYSVSFDHTALPVNFWRNLANALILNGWDVVFNSQGETYSDFKQIFLPMAPQVEFAKLCSATVGFRSGLLDVLAASGIANITAIYPKEMNFLTLSKQDLEKEFRKSYFFEDDLTVEENIFNICSLNNTFRTKIYNDIIYSGIEKQLLDRLLKIILKDEYIRRVPAPNKKGPRVSIIIPYYNDEKYLKYSIESALNQEYENLELILVNHASTDNSPKIAHSYNDDRIIHVDFDENNLAGGGMFIIEKFLQVATGQYIKTFCADDILLPNCLGDCVKYMEDNPDVDFAFGNLVHINSAGYKFPPNTTVYDHNNLPVNFNSWFTNLKNWNLIKELKGTIYPNLPNIIRMYYDMETDNPLPYPGAIIRRTAFNDIELQRIYVMMADMSLWFSLLLHNKKIGFINKEIVLYRMHDGSCSSDFYRKRNLRILFWEKQAFWKMGLQCKNIAQLKQVFPEDKYINKLSVGDEDLIPFCIARHYAYLKNYPNQASAVLELFNMINSGLAAKIKNKFNFGIKDMRQLYIYSDITEDLVTVDIEPLNSSTRKNHFLKTIFSITNSSDKKLKIITIFGAELKVKNWH